MYQYNFLQLTKTYVKLTLHTPISIASLKLTPNGTYNKVLSRKLSGRDLSCTLDLVSVVRVCKKRTSLNYARTKWRQKLKVFSCYLVVLTQYVNQFFTIYFARIEAEAACTQVIKWTNKNMRIYINDLLLEVAFTLSS